MSNFVAGTLFGFLLSLGLFGGFAAGWLMGAVLALL